MEELQDLRRHAALAPNRCAVACGPRRLTYGALEALSNRLAALWRGAGLRRGEHVATLMGNEPEALAAAWAAWRCGVYLTPIPTTLAPLEAATMLRDCDARLLLAGGTSFTARELASKVAGLVDEPLQWHSVGGTVAGFKSIDTALDHMSG